MKRRFCRMEKNSVKVLAAIFCRCICEFGNIRTQTATRQYMKGCTSVTYGAED